MQELYTATFDLGPACAPYLGTHLLGEDSPVRGPLLATLAELHAAEGFRPREELQDHVAEVLGFVAMARPGPARDDLVRDGLLPALAKMIEALPDANPYREPLAAARAAAEPLVAPEAGGGRRPAGGGQAPALRRPGTSPPTEASASGGKSSVRPEPAEGRTGAR
jgi:nitrate reductase delta subunit